jgi:outer membrane protein assembly factor BamB
MLPYLCVALLAMPQGNDWPQYRGPTRTGAVVERDWSPTGRTEPLWATNVGRGYSCPSIVDGRLVTIGFDEAAGVDRVVCLDAKTGEARWQFAFAASDDPKYHGGGTLTTPTIDAGLVYCLSRAGKFHVLKLATGELVWFKDYHAELHLEKTFHGYSASPLLHGDRIYLQFGGVVAAVARKDGELLWRSEDRGDMAYSNLALLEVDGKAALAGIVGMSFVVFACADGEVLRDYPWPVKGNGVHCAVPIAVDQDRVFVSTAYGKGATMLRMGKDKVPEKVWSNLKMRNKVTACVLHEQHLYGFDESMLRCVDIDGNSKWRVRGLGLGSLSLAGGRLLVLSSDGELIVADASPAGFQELSRRKVLDGGEYWTMPVLVDGLIYVRNSLGDLKCLDHRLATEPAQDAAADALMVAPAPQVLFANHAAAMGKKLQPQPGKALRLRGKWSIPLRGVKDDAMTLVMVAPDRFLLSLDEGGLSYTFDGKRAWAVEPQGARMVVGDELLEVQQLFPLATLLAPPCPPVAKTAPKPVLFAEMKCWRVTEPLASNGSKPTTRSYFFATDTGLLRGTEGATQSTLVFAGMQKLGEMTLPKSITRFRLEDGQEHVMQIASAQWWALPADFVALPAEVQRILRTSPRHSRATRPRTRTHPFATTSSSWSCATGISGSTRPIPKRQCALRWSWRRMGSSRWWARR